MGLIKYEDKTRLKKESIKLLDLSEEDFIKKLEGCESLTDLRFMLLGCWYFFDQFQYIQAAFLKSSVQIPRSIRNGVKRLGLRVKDNGMMGGMQVYRWMCKVLGDFDEIIGMNHRYLEEVKEE